MWYKFTLFVGLLATAIALGGALAHAFELLNKMPLSREDYFVAQRLYDGWNQLAIVLSVEATAMIALAIRTRHDRALFVPAIIALAALIAAQAIFWIWTFPANRATENWTSIPGNWAQLRRQWEYSHFAGAIFQLVAFGAVAWVAVAGTRQPACRPAS